jgi:hypothetical protein
MNPYRYYFLAAWAASLKELGGSRFSAATFMTCFNMMMNERRLAAVARFSGKRLRAHVAGLILPFAGAALMASTALAADATHPTRLHRTAAQSAGTAETRGKVQPSKPSTRRDESAVSRRRGKATKPAGEAAHSKEAEKADAVPLKPHTRSRRRKREPEVVDDPIVMSRAGSRVKTRKVSHEQTSVEHPAQPQAPAEKKPLTVDDFVRAAGGAVSAQPSAAAPAPTSPEVYAQGVSHPDENERIVTNDEPADQPKLVAAPKPAAVQKPAPIVRAAATKSNDVSVAGVNYDDAPQPGDLPRSKVVQGFGGEVEVLPPAPAARIASAVRRNAVAAADDATPETKASQREATDDAVKLMVVPLYSRNGKLIVPPPLKGTREILVHQNTMADGEGLTRIQDDTDLDRMRAQHLLMPFPEMAALEVNEELPLNRRYARPWTVKFATDTARQFYARFHEPLHLNSAVRTVDYQLRLMRVNGNAAAVDGDTASPHLTGQAIDLGKRGMSVAEIAWMRSYLQPLMQAGKIDVEEEFQQACFHISVYGSYGPKKKVVRTEVAQLR